MVHSYSDLYLDDAMENLGDYFDYMINELDYSPEEAYTLFVKSGVALEFGSGNPKYIAGMSGVDLAVDVLYRIKNEYLEIDIVPKYTRSKEFWMGWIYAYYQWFKADSFKNIYNRGITPEFVLDRYETLHEADVSMFLEKADYMYNNGNEKSKLQIIRKERGFTQKQLARLSGVSLRMVQLYEQQQQDISKAEVKSVLNLAKALSCDVDDIL